MPSRREFLGAFVAGATLAGPERLRLLGSSARVQIGVCAAPSDMDKADQFGFDYLEPPAAAVAAMSEADFQAFRARVLSSRLRCPSFNSFIRTLRVVGDDIQHQQLQAYLSLCLSRCRELGAEVVVCGSASSRNVPEGFSRERAWEQIKDFLRLAGDAARPHQCVIAIEALRHQESNIINTSAESLRLVREVNHRNVRMIVDYYHMRVENEDPEIIWRARHEIVHFHFANPQGRRWPKSATR